MWSVVLIWIVMGCVKKYRSWPHEVPNIILRLDTVIDAVVVDCFQLPIVLIYTRRRGLTISCGQRQEGVDERLHTSLVGTLKADKGKWQGEAVEIRNRNGLGD